MSYKRVPWGRIFLGIVVFAVGVPCLWLYPDYRIANAFTADELRGYEDKLTDGYPPRVNDALPTRSGKVVLVVSSKRKPGGRFVINDVSGELPYVAGAPSRVSTFVTDDAPDRGVADIGQRW